MEQAADTLELDFGLMGGHPDIAQEESTPAELNPAEGDSEMPADVSQQD